MSKRQQKNPPILRIGTLLLAGTAAGVFWYSPEARETAKEYLKQGIELVREYSFYWNSEPPPVSDGPSPVLPLALVPPEARAAQLQEIASGEYSLDRSRARYLLASDLIDQYEGGQALRLLQGLERQYPTMAPYIILKRGRAYELTNETAKAQEIWLQLREKYPDSPVVAEALALLSRYQPAYEQELVQSFPAHPRTQEIIRQKLATNPDQFQFLLILAKYDHNFAANSIRDRLVSEFNGELKSEDWEAIAAGYWQNGEYRKAADAYQYAPTNPRSLYRRARGMQISGNLELARSGYQKLIDQFPDAQETGLALKHLATLSGAKASLFYLDILIEKFPEQAAEALYKKAIILDYLNSYQSAQEARATLLEKYPNSEAAAEYLWSVAEKQAQAGDKQGAVATLAPLLTTTNPGDMTPKALFWGGKWALEIGQKAQSQAFFEKVLSDHWQSYFAWRSASMLGWEVGDFSTVRSMSPTVIQPTSRYRPPAGSETFQELYLLGQDSDAQTLLDAEIGDRQDLTVAEQFTKGLLMVEQGKYRQAVNLIWSLKQREEPREQQQWQALRHTPQYWHALFPFPYYDTILHWSDARDLNPLLVISLIRQESTFEVDAESPVGATGLMQVMPSTAKWIASISEINEDFSLVDPEDNIELGTWYFDHTHTQYDNNSLLAIASYNAGPGNVRSWEQRYSLKDLDKFVENIPFPETQGYVESVLGNYWNYLRIYNPAIAEQLSRYSGTNLTAQE